MTEKNKTTEYGEAQTASNNAISEQHSDTSLSDLEVDVPLTLSDQYIDSNLDLIILRKKLEQQMAEKVNQLYWDVRRPGKGPRMVLTDAIQAFVEYAKLNGSQRADWYFCNVTSAIYEACFIIETKIENILSLLTPEQLYTMGTAELVAANVLTQGMENKLPYKDIFQQVKKALEIFALGRTRVAED
jgi:hypothetical protein